MKESKLPEIKTPKTTAPEEIVSEEETADWQTYRNEKYGFELRYPESWIVTTMGFGGHVPATENEENFFIEENSEIRGVFFDIAALGSERLGTYYSSAINLDEYLSLIPIKDEKGMTIRRTVREVTIGDRRAIWQEVYGWNPENKLFEWAPRVYFQNKDDIYEIGKWGSVSAKVFNQILSTFRFIK